MPTMTLAERADRADERLSAAERVRDAEQVQTLAGALARQAQEQIAIKRTIEERWLDDLNQYHGHYDKRTGAELRAQEKSTLYFNVTRPKTTAWEARLSEMLFPTDEKNWSIAPTPDPELSRAARNHGAYQGRHPGPAQDPAEMQGAQGPVQDLAQDPAKAVQAEAEAAARRMSQKIDDQFIECGYNAEARLAIHDLFKLGSAIMKGPVAMAKRARRWQADEAGDYSLSEAQNIRPGIHRSDPWGQFPDMSARNVSECEFWFERFLLPKKSLLALAKRPGFDAGAIHRVAGHAPGEGLPDWFTRLREMTGSGQDSPEHNRYHVWEYRGPVKLDDMIAAARSLDDFDLLEILISQNALEEVDAVIWFVGGPGGGQVIKAGANQLESGELPYAVASMEADETSLFGFGVPALMRQSQKAVNAAWRAMMDNAGLTSGPQVVINKDVIAPQDGNWRLAARKIWLRKNAQTQHQAAFETYDLQNNQSQLAAIVQMGRDFIDEEVSLPLVAQGEQGAVPQQTASGMAMLMNSANVAFRRVVKIWDDEITVPNVTRMYDWNMQFSDDDGLKGDFEVEAIGSSVLLTRELQTQNLMQILSAFSGHPVLGPMLKAREGLEALVQSLLLKASDLVKSEEELMAEIEAMQQAQAQGAPEAEAETAKIEAEMRLEEMRHHSAVALAEMKAGHELQLAAMKRDAEMMKLAAGENTTLEKIGADLERTNKQIESHERRFAAEVALKNRFGEGI